MTQKRYEAHFSHEFADGHSGPARSYWDIRTTSGANIMTLCLHPEAENAPNPKSMAETVCYALDRAFEAGRNEKAREIRDVLGVRS